MPRDMMNIAASFASFGWGSVRSMMLKTSDFDGGG